MCAECRGHCCKVIAITHDESIKCNIKILQLINGVHSNNNNKTTVIIVTKNPKWI